MTRESYLYVSKVSDFEESTALCQVTFAELDKKSTNNRVYRFSDAQGIIQSLIGSVVKFGVDKMGKHIRFAPLVGIVESAFLEGKTIKGKIRIDSQDIINKLKKGIKFLVSIGGFGSAIVHKTFTEIVEPIIEHVQIWQASQTNILGEKQIAGFSKAKIEKVLEIEESCLVIGHVNTLAVLTALELV